MRSDIESKNQLIIHKSSFVKWNLPEYVTINLQLNSYLINSKIVLMTDRSDKTLLTKSNDKMKASMFIDSTSKIYSLITLGKYNFSLIIDNILMVFNYLDQWSISKEMLMRVLFRVRIMQLLRTD